MKRYGKMILSAVCAAVLLLSGALADVVWEPVGDSFYEKHRGECQYLYRSYTANGPEGYLTLWKAPNSSAQQINIPNGEHIGGTWRYTAPGGEEWACTEWEHTSGWFKLSETLQVSDYISFRENYGGQFIPYDGTCDHAFDGLETIVLWSYPGGGVESESFPADWFSGETDFASAFGDCYRDGEGRLWGYVAYAMGERNVWLCLSDPANAGLTCPEVSFPTVSGTGEETQRYAPSAAVPETGDRVGITAMVLVAAVAAVTAALIPVVCKKKKA